jgi:uroporphyrinogen decarboxylase
MSLLLEAIAGKAERVPVAPLITLGHACRITGVAQVDYVLKPESYAEAQLKTKRYYGYDWVWSHQFFQGPSERERQSAERVAEGVALTLDFGARLLIPHKGMPRVLSVALSNKEELSELEVPEIGDEKMAPLKLLLESEGFAAGNLRMPFTFAATLLYPLESFLLDLSLDKRFVHALLDYAYRYNLELAKAMIDAGAELIFTEDPSASSSVISPSHYREFAYPYEKKLIREIKRQGAKTVLHICGDVSALFEDMLTLGVDAISVDESMDMAMLREKTVAWGNIAPALLVSGSPGEVAEASRAIVALREGVVLSSGCVVPGNAKPENIAAMVAAAKE